ncbi:hypothetical protein CEXT_639201 [Caerostris extrusa]|uniref:Uncharacterized protein n=1 Tax=Caerostris extrusa TaxID=172846 RepID=A0AAV4TKU2_CAEEX|nr:hypothetical protein CEXT_639201 [Caerostris extrusa]
MPNTKLLLCDIPKKISTISRTRRNFHNILRTKQCIPRRLCCVLEDCAMGYMVYMDENGDAEGNYTLIARKPVPGVNGEYGLYPVGVST